MADTLKVKEQMRSSTSSIGRKSLQLLRQHKKIRVSKYPKTIFTLCGNKYIVSEMKLFNKRLTAILKDYLKISFKHQLWHAFFH